MVTRSVVTLGVSTERGAVHAVALAEGGKLSERVLTHSVERAPGDTGVDVAAAVEAALDGLAAELGPECEVNGAAITYRDTAERRAIVARLASGRWHTAAMVSPRSAHLSMASMMTWLDDYENLLVCEVVPGYQAFTLVDRGRRRVLAAVARSGRPTRESLDAAVAAAVEQFAAAASAPDAVVLLGSGCAAPAVRAAVRELGVPVIPCRMAAYAVAAGAALSGRRVEVAYLPEPVREAVARPRGAAVMLAAASVLAGGMVLGGMYVMDGAVRHPDTVAAADRDVMANARRLYDGWAGPAGRAGSPGAAAPGGRASSWSIAAEGPNVESGAGALDQVRHQSWPGLRNPLPLLAAEPAEEAEATASDPLLPGSGVPTTSEVGTPAGGLLLLFPGESPPPPVFGPEAVDWWNRHLRLMAQWGTQQVIPR